jgi:hypothetical protein
MSKLDDRIAALEKKQKDNEIQQGIASGIKLRCLTFWSSMIAICGLIGSWCNEHFDAVKAGFLAFWTVLWSK